MKSLLLLLVLSSRIFSFAQGFDLGIGGGGYYKPMLIGRAGVSVPSEQRDLSASRLFRLSAARNIGEWQIGASLGVASISGRYANRMFTTISLWWDPNRSEEELQRIHYEANNPVYRIRYIPMQLFLNHKLDLGNFILYGGVSAGGTLMQRVEGPPSPVVDGKRGICIRHAAGLQLGCRYKLGKHIGLNAELAASYMNLGNKLFVISYPLTAGVSYSFY